MMHKSVAEWIAAALGASLLLAVILVPLVAPGFVQSPVQDPWVPFMYFLYGLLWFLLAILALDSTSYIYSFDRPIFSHSPRGYSLVFRRSVIRTPRGVVLRSLSSYGLAIYLYAIAVSYLSHRDPSAYNVGALDLSASIYFSVATAATVGYGDIAPKSPEARWLAVAEIITSFLYAVLIFSLVASVAREKQLAGGQIKQD